MRNYPQKKGGAESEEKDYDYSCDYAVLFFGRLRGACGKANEYTYAQ